MKKGIVIFTICIFIIGISNYVVGSDYVKTFSYNEYHAIEGAAEISDESRACRVWCPDTNTKSAVATTTFALEPGSYDITIKYNTLVEGNMVRIFSEMAANQQNEKGIELGKAELKPESNELVLPLTVDRLYLDVAIQFYCTQGEFCIQNVEVRSTSPHFTDSLFLVILFLIILLIIWFVYKKKNENPNEFLIPTLLIATIFISAIPYFNDFLINGHDIYHHLARIEGIYYGLLNGEIPVRINPIQLYGYGYDMPIMYPDLFLYIPALFRLCGVSLMLSYKVFIFLIHVATVVISYFCFKRVLKLPYIAVIASMIYTLGNYRIADIYERAALGEILAMVFLPLIIWSIYEILEGNSKRWIWASVGYAGIFMSHMLSTLMVVIFSVLAVGIALPKLWREKKRIVHLVYAAIVTIFMILWNAVPLISFMRLPFNIVGVREPLYSSAVYFSQVFSQGWAEGFSGNVNLGQTKNEMPLSIGIIILVGILLFLFFYLSKKQKEHDLYRIGFYTFIMGGIALFMASWMFPWELLQRVEWIDAIASKFQFSFRFLLLASTFWSITAAIGIALFFGNEIKEKQLLFIAIGIFVITMGFLDGTLEKETIPNKSQLVGTNTNDNLYMYEGINPYNWYLNGESIVISNDASVKISDYIKRGTTIEFYATINGRTEDSYFELPLAYYPGYQAKMENEMLEVSMAENGMLHIPMPSKSGVIVTEYKEKLVWLLADIISIFTWIAVASVGIKKVGWKKHEH